MSETKRLRAEEESKSSASRATPVAKENNANEETIVVDWELRYQELNAVHSVFCVALRKAVGMECPMPIRDILDNVISLAEFHSRTRREDQVRRETFKDNIALANENIDLKKDIGQMLNLLKRCRPNVKEEGGREDCLDCEIHDLVASVSPKVSASQRSDAKPTTKETP